MTAHAALDAPDAAPHDGLAARGLVVSAHGGPIAGPLDLDLRPGRPLTLLGETGAGKSLVAQAILGALPAGLEAHGALWLGAERLDAMRRPARRALWGRRLALLPQEPWHALDPTMRAGRQVAEAARLVAGHPRAEAARAAAGALTSLGVAHAARLYPHQLSGGMAQRVAFAAATVAGAPALVADEPTKGLDAAMRERVADLLLAVARGGGLLLTITHDVGLARRLGGEVALMRAGRIVEGGPAERLLSAPASAYGRDLLAAEPRAWPRREARAAGPVALSCEGLTLARGGEAILRRLDLALRAGERVALTGPSGAGKSSLLDALAGLLRPDEGSVTRAPGLPRHAVQKLYQDPPAAFPRGLPLRLALRDLERRHRLSPERIPALLDRLGVARSILDRPPGGVSGGELQRVALARVLALRPAVILADEPSSRLDLLTQRRLMDLLGAVADEEGSAVLLVTHDPDIAEAWADRTLSPWS